MFLANAVHLFTYHAVVLNLFPVTAVVVLAFLAFLFLYVVSEDTTAIALFFVFGTIAAVLALVFPWHHTELRKGAEIQIVVDGKKVWIPAKRLPSGEYWPITFTRTLPERNIFSGNIYEENGVGTNNGTSSCVGCP